MLVIPLLCFGWLACIIALLVLNFKGYVAGASIGCGVRTCNDNPGSSSYQQNSERLQREDHDILGALQLVAKALEVWFIFLAGALMWDMAMLLARRGDGLPLRYLVLPAEYSEFLSFTSRTMWTSPSPLRSEPATTEPDADADIDLKATRPVQPKPEHEQYKSPNISTQPKARAARPTRRRTIYMLVGFAAVLSMVCNLMGPATAVLLLPTLAWRNVTIPNFKASRRWGRHILLALRPT